MVTTDNDDEIAKKANENRQPRKARIVMEYELDAIFIANKRFEKSSKVHQIHYLFEFLKKLCQK